MPVPPPLLGPMPRPVPVLEAGKVRLRPIDPSADARAYWALYQDARIATHVGDVIPDHPDAAAAELTRLASLSSHSFWMILDRRSEALVGRYFLTRWAEGTTMVVGEGVRIAPHVWRTGIHRHARALLMAYAFGELGADAVVTKTRVANRSMVAAALAYGFEPGPVAPEGTQSYATFRLSRTRWMAGVPALALPP